MTKVETIQPDRSQLFHITNAIVDDITNWSALRAHDGNNISVLDWGRLSSLLNTTLKDAMPKATIEHQLLEDFDSWLPYTRDIDSVHNIVSLIVCGHIVRHLEKDDTILNDVSKVLKGKLGYIARTGMDVVIPNHDHQIAMMLVGRDEELARKQASVDVKRAIDAGLKL